MSTALLGEEVKKEYCSSATYSHTHTYAHEVNSSSRYFVPWIIFCRIQCSTYSCVFFFLLLLTGPSFWLPSSLHQELCDKCVWHHHHHHHRRHNAPGTTTIYAAISSKRQKGKMNLSIEAIKYGENWKREREINETNYGKKKKQWRYNWQYHNWNLLQLGEKKFSQMMRWYPSNRMLNWKRVWTDLST